MRWHLQAACHAISARQRSAWWAGGLFGLLLAVLLAGGVPTVHGHDAPGLYDEDCPLVWLTVAKPAVTLASAPVMGPSTPGPDAMPLVHVIALADVGLASFDPRAPPRQTHLRVLAH